MNDEQSKDPHAKPTTSASMPGPAGSDFEARLSAFQPSPPQLSWSELEAQVTADSPEPQSITVARRFPVGMFYSWTGGMVVGACLMYLLLSYWPPLQADTQIAGLRDDRLPESTTTSSPFSSVNDGRPQAGLNNLAGDSQLAEDSLGTTQRQQLWLDSLSLGQEVALDARQPLTAGKHFVSVGRPMAAAVDAESVPLPPSSELNGGVGGQIPRAAPATSRNLLQDMLENERDLLL